MNEHIQKLVYMANQIGRFFVAQGDEAAAAAGVADHLEKFWSPRMRAEIIAWLQGGGEGLEPAARAGVSRLAEPVITVREFSAGTGSIGRSDLKMTTTTANGGFLARSGIVASHRYNRWLAPPAALAV